MKQSPTGTATRRQFFSKIKLALSLDCVKVGTVNKVFTMKRYHYQIGFPKGVTFAPVFGIKYSLHAREQALEDRYGQLVKLPVHFLPRVAKIIEIEMEDEEVTKILYRQKYDENLDIVVALIPQAKMVKTVWVNERSDAHRTLDRSQYDRP